MTKLHLMAVATAAALASTLAFAQTAPVPAKDPAAMRAANTAKAPAKRAAMHRFDTDGDGRISRAEAQAAGGDFARRFDRMDVNRDGYIDRADRQLRMQQQRDNFFAAADTNKDGRLSRDEFVVERSARAGQMRERLQERMEKRAEAGGKVRPQPTEAERMQRAGAMFDRIDGNRDGFISRAEWDAAKPMDGRGHGKHRRGDGSAPAAVKK